MPEIDNMINNNTTPNVISQVVGSGEGNVYATLPLPVKGREVVSNRPSAQEKEIQHWRSYVETMENNVYVNRREFPDSTKMLNINFLIRT